MPEPAFRATSRRDKPPRLVGYDLTPAKISWLQKTFSDKFKLDSEQQIGKSWDLIDKDKQTVAKPAGCSSGT